MSVMIQPAGVVAALVCVAAYGVSTATNRPRVFAWANAVTAPALAAAAVQAHAWAALIITLFFGAIGAAAVARPDRRHRHAAPAVTGD